MLSLEKRSRPSSSGSKEALRRLPRLSSTSSIWSLATRSPNTSSSSMRYREIRSVRCSSGNCVIRPPISSTARRASRRAPSLRCALAPVSFELDCLVLSGFIKRGSPDLVRSLVFGAAKTELRSKAEVEIAHILQDVDEPFGIELWSGTFECLDQDVGRNVAFKRHVVRCFAGKIFGQGALVFENDARIAGNRRHNLGHDCAGCIARSQQLQFFGERGAADE